MKLSIVQIMLGLGILIAMALSIVWDPTGFYIRVGEPGSWQTIFNPDTKEVIATILAFLILLLGLAIIGGSIALLNAKIRSEYIKHNSEMSSKVKRLIITQMVLGLLVAVSAFLVYIWGFPTSSHYTLSDNIGRGISFMPGHQFILAQNLNFLTFLIGIAALGCSIAQFRSVGLSKVGTVDNQQ